MATKKSRPEVQIPSPLNDEQKRLIKTIERNQVTLVSGSAGTGKTFVAMWEALYELSKKKYKKLVLIRPAVEANGENLGFLPGTAEEKISVYMTPFMDSAEKILNGKEALVDMIDNGIIKTSPLAYLRGITFDDSIVILDEAQNTTVQQMHLFLTRIGESSKVVVCGDLRQVDRQFAKTNGLKDAIERLSGVVGIGIVEMPDSCIVRSKIVAAIESRYAHKEKDELKAAPVEKIEHGYDNLG